ncbi:MAG: amidase family protein [Pseudomonadota bacterium]
MEGLRRLAMLLDIGQITSTQLVEQALEKAHRSKSVFTTINPGLISLSYSIDRARKRHQSLAPLAGIPIALKDLFNVRNEKTFSGSVVRKHYAKPEAADADVVAPLRRAGLLFFGRTNMSEFAFSGMGVNPHYGTPKSIWDRETGRLPGGSSSGSGVCVAEEILCAALGSDTAGSCRIPAAFNGIVGVKPSFGRMSLNGIFPLSPTLDAPGPLAVDVDSCYILDQLMCGRSDPEADLPTLDVADIKSSKFVIPDAIVMQDLDDEVSQSFQKTIGQLETAGARIETKPMPSLDRVDEFFANRPIVAKEVWENHQHMLEAHGDEYDPFVSQRISGGASITEAEQTKRYQERDEIVQQFHRELASFHCDALIYPTVACLPPPISETIDEDNARKVNLRCLRNTATINYSNGCAISLPCQDVGQAPVGFMLAAANGEDENLYRQAAAVERIIRS